MIFTHIASILVFTLFNCTAFAQIRIVSWNIQNFGTQKEDQLNLMTCLLSDADIVVIQEVQIDFDGTKAIEMLEAELEKTGKIWNSTTSLPTHGKGTERYSFLWKSATITLEGQAWLETSMDSLLDREPYLARFRNKGKSMLLANFHAVPKKKMPWLEIKELDKLDKLYNNDNLIIIGDFNLSEDDSSFSKLKSLGFNSALHKVKTTIKMEPKGQEKFANAYDNFLYEKGRFDLLEAGRLDFTVYFSTLQEARKVSDHLPIYVLIK